MHPFLCAISTPCRLKYLLSNGGVPLALELTLQLTTTQWSVAKVRGWELNFFKKHEKFGSISSLKQDIVHPGAVFTKGLSQVLGLGWLYFYTKVKPKTWLRPFVNTAPGLSGSTSQTDLGLECFFP